MSTRRFRLPLLTTSLTVGLAITGNGLPGSAAAEGTLAQRLACTPDAMRLCSAEMPNAQAVKTCMIANKGKLSARCLATFPIERASR